MKRICFRDKHQTILQLLLLFLIICTFYSLLKVGFVTGDDLEYFINSDIYRWNDISKFYASGTGRFHYLLIFWIYNIPYLIDSQVYYYAVLIIPLIIAFLLFVRFVNRYTKHESVATLAALFYLTSFQIFGGHTPPAAYPLFFALSVILLLCGLLLLMRFYEKNRYQLLVFSALLIFCSTLFYESCLLNYFTVLLIIILKQRNQEWNKKQYFRKILAELAPYIILCATYLIIYTLYYCFHPSQYTGNSFAQDFTLGNYFKKIFELASFSFPFSSYLNSRFYLCEHLETLQPCFHPILSVFLHGGWVAYLKSFTAIAIFYITATSVTNLFSNKKLIIIALCSLCIPFLFVTPLAFSEKYYSTIPNSYPSSYFSFFYVIIFLLVIYLLFNQWIKQKKLKKIFQIFIGIIIFITTLFTQYTNEKITDDLQLSSYRFELMDDLLTSQNLNDGDVVYFGELHRSSSYYTRAVTRQSDMFAAYLFNKNGIKVHSYTDYSLLYQAYHDSEQSIKVLHYSQAEKTGESFLSISSCQGKSLTPTIEDLKVDTVVVGYLSINKRFSVSIVSDSCPPLIAGSRMPFHKGSFSYANLYYFGKDKICSFKLSGENLYPVTLMVSDQQYYDYSYQVMSHFPSHFEQRYASHFAKKIQKDKTIKQSIKSKADKSGISFEKALEGDALWLIYHNK